MFMIFSINGLAVIGMTLVLISGGIDLSVGSVMALVGVVTGSLFLTFKMDIWLAAAGGPGWSAPASASSTASSSPGWACPPSSPPWA